MSMSVWQMPTRAVTYLLVAKNLGFTGTLDHLLLVDGPPSNGAAIVADEIPGKEVEYE